MTCFNERLQDDTLVIFLFHGVVADNKYKIRNYTRKHLDKNYFASVIRGLKKKGYSLSMEDVRLYVQNGEPFPPRSFAITFDDGFENNFSVAAPILAEMGVKATFYITTGFVGDNGMSWTDRIEYCLESVTSGVLSFPWSSTKQSFNSTDGKIKLLDEIRLNVKQDHTIDVQKFADDIFRQCGRDQVRNSSDPLDQKMSWAQVKQLDEDPGFVVGGHTHTHPIMSFLGPEELEREISLCLRLLKEKAGVAPLHYSYPEGLSYCYSEEVIAALKEHGVVCCPTAIDGVNTISDGLFHLKRVMVT